MNQLSLQNNTTMVTFTPQGWNGTIIAPSVKDMPARIDLLVRSGDDIDAFEELLEWLPSQVSDNLVDATFHQFDAFMTAWQQASQQAARNESETDMNTPDDGVRQQPRVTACANNRKHGMTLDELQAVVDRADHLRGHEQVWVDVSWRGRIKQLVAERAKKR